MDTLIDTKVGGTFIIDSNWWCILTVSCYIQSSYFWCRDSIPFPVMGMRCVEVLSVWLNRMRNSYFWKLIAYKFYHLKMIEEIFFCACIASYWSWNLLACSPGKMYGIMAFSCVDLNTNINWILTWNEKNKPTKLLFVLPIMAAYTREYIDTGMDRKRQKPSFKTAEC